MERMRVESRHAGLVSPCVGAKDLMLALIARYGTSGGAGHAVEYAGAAVRAMTMEARISQGFLSFETTAERPFGKRA
jgi:3-isopropylmalate/(R)-2-methylmalate dehydratase large subunit